jgi:hypothetical protein
MTQRRVRWFYAIEAVESGQPHMHALLSGTHIVTIDQIKKCWQLGISDMRRDDPTRKGTLFVTKEIGTRDWDWFDHSKRLPLLLDTQILAQSKPGSEVAA